MALVLDAPCLSGGLEEHIRPSVVSLERSLVSECRDPVPDGWERMVFRVDRRLAPFATPRETWEWR